uniref:Cytochrome P450 n=1 Tax=Thermosporothrix sp. COM3 TaxID=2490863 RepID=A0A455STC0_9CHLR|nr:cytochrome P450 [Thermosporothrix sp. COM3]
MSIATSITAKEIPYLRGWPLVGCQLALKYERLHFLQRLSQLGDIAGFSFGTAPHFLVNSPQLIQEVLVEHAATFYHRGRYLRRAFIGNGLIISDGEFHRKQRKLMATLFQPRHLATYAETITRYGEQFQQEMRHGEVIDLHQKMIDLAMSIFSKVLFDLEIRPGDEMMEAMDIALAHSAKVLFSLVAIPIHWPTPYNKRLQQARQVLQKRIRGAFQQRKENPEHLSEQNDLLSLLLQASDDDGRRMSDQQVLDECRTLFIAGFETIAMALIWTWYLLAQHPEVCQKVQKEVDSVLGGRTPTYEDLANLPYCLQVFKETLRLYPPAPMIRREARDDVEVGGYHLARGSTVLISAYTLHRRADYFPEPERFDPERFSPEREKQLPRYAYLPFGGGPRVCLGNHFALMEGHLLLATLAQRLRFELVANHPEVGFDLEHNLALRPDRKIEVIVHKRTEEEKQG